VGWSTDFVAGLGSGSIVPEFELKFVEVYGSVGDGITLGSTGVTWPVQTKRIKIDAGSVQVQGTTVIPQRWSVSFGGWSVGLVGDIRDIAGYIRRGQFAELHCRLNGFSGFERIAMGSLDGLSGSRGVWRLTFRDLISTFQNRLNNHVRAGVYPLGYDKFQLFNRAGATTTTTSTWNTVDTTMDVTAALDWDLPTGGQALVQCFTSATDYFFVKYTGKTAIELSGVAGVDYPVGNVAVGTLSSGSTIKYCPWVRGYPWVIMGMLIDSTGTGANGPFDVYPGHWGIGGMYGAGIYDNFDAHSINGPLIKRSDGSTRYRWSHAITSPWAGGFRDLIGLSSSAGQWPVQRQGYVSWRGCSDPTGLEMGYEPTVAARINTSDIQEIITHEFYNSSIQNHYANVLANIVPQYNGASTMTPAASNFTNNRVPSLPYIQETVRDLRFVYDDDDGTGAEKRNEMAVGDLNRMKGWDFYPSEKLVLRVGLKFAILCAGDVVEITSQFLSGLYMGRGNSFNAQRAMVLNCSYVFGSASCVLQLGILSGREKR